MKTDTRRITFACAGVVAIAAIIWAPRPHEGLSGDARDAPTIAARQRESHMITVREYLAAYWGANWPELLTQIPADKLPLLETLINPSEIPPWESVEPTFRTTIRDGFQARRGQWIQEYRDKGRDLILTGAVMGSEAKALTVSDRLQLQDIVDTYSSDIETLAAQSFDFSSEAEERIWDTALYCACPLINFCSPGNDNSRAAIIVKRCYSGNSWVVSYTLDSSDWPELEQSLRQIALLRDQRQREALQYLRSL